MALSVSSLCRLGQPLEQFSLLQRTLCLLGARHEAASQGSTQELVSALGSAQQFWGLLLIVSIVMQRLIQRLIHHQHCEMQQAGQIIEEKDMGGMMPTI